MSLQEDLEQVLEPLRALPKQWRRAAPLLASEAFQAAVALLEPAPEKELLALASGDDALEGLVGEQRSGPALRFRQRPQTVEQLLELAHVSSASSS